MSPESVFLFWTRKIRREKVPHRGIFGPFRSLLTITLVLALFSMLLIDAVTVIFVCFVIDHEKHRERNAKAHLGDSKDTTYVLLKEKMIRYNPF